MGAKKERSKLKIAISILSTAAIIIGIGSTVLFSISKSVVNDYKSEIIEQLNSVIGGDNTGSSVELRRVWLAGVFDQNYKNVASLQPEYKELLDSAKNYVTILNIHNTIVKLYNDGMENDQSLNANLLTSIKKYLSSMETHFPDEAERIQKLSDLSDKVADSTIFSAISDDLGRVLADNEQWLTSLREKLDEQIMAFQKKLN